MKQPDNIAKSVGKASFLGRTLPSLLYHAAVEHPNPVAFVQRSDDGWTPYSTDEFREAAEETALGLCASGLNAGDRVALYMDSDVYFCLVDMGCLMAGLVDVPIYLTHTPESISYVLEHADAQAVVVSDRGRLNDILPVLNSCASVHLVVLVEDDPSSARAELRDGIDLKSLREIRSIGKNMNELNPTAVRELSDHLAPNDLATIIYTSGTTGRPKGVMLTHENISSNALACHYALSGYLSGVDGEIVLSFLPLTHVFARTNYYLALSQGSSLYFTTPDNLVEDMQDIRPTMLITVPRVLEKVYARILENTHAAGGIKGRIARWGLSLAQQTGGGSDTLNSIQRRIADPLVFKRWREAFGGRLRFLISGGAALSREIADVFGRAGLPVLQGYGLTETSPVITFNRPGENRPGTVGRAVSGVEIRLGEDGEILTRGSHVMAGYFQDEEQTHSVMLPDGWFATGDVGELSDDGYLTITDRKKDLFKLSTGKYVTPQPLENKMAASPLIEQAVVVGHGHKFASALLFPEPGAIKSLARSLKIVEETPDSLWITDDRIITRFRNIVERANQGMPHWSTVKRFVIIQEEVSIENGLLTPTMKIRRSEVRKRYSEQIEKLYSADHDSIVVESSG